MSIPSPTSLDEDIPTIPISDESPSVPIVESIPSLRDEDEEGEGVGGEGEEGGEEGRGEEVAGEEVVGEEGGDEEIIDSQEVDEEIIDSQELEEGGGEEGEGEGEGGEEEGEGEGGEEGEEEGGEEGEGEEGGEEEGGVEESTPVILRKPPAKVADILSKSTLSRLAPIKSTTDFLAAIREREMVASKKPIKVSKKEEPRYFEDSGDVPLSLEDMIIREPTEDEQTFLLRKQYTLLLDSLSSPFNRIDDKGKVTLGYMVVRKAQYGIKYDPKTEHMISIIQEEIFGNYV